MKTLRLEQSCEIDNLIDVMAERMCLKYEEVESMSLKEGIFPDGNKTFVTTQFGRLNDDRPLCQAIYDMMIEKGIRDMFITYPI